MSSPARALLILVIITQPLFVPRSSLAEIDFTSKTYIKFYNDARDDKYAPLYEYVELENKNLENGRLNLYLSGWWGHDFITEAEGNRNRDELTYAFLRYAPYQDKRLLLSVGRHYVFEGVASEQIDGISTQWEITPYTGFSLFGGVPVETDFDKRGGDSAYGGRIYQRIKYKAEVGLSVLKEENNGARFRDETGVDIWLLPLKNFEVKGHSFYNNITEGWNEHAYTLRFFPLERFTLSGSFSRSSYEDAFSARTLNAFSPDFLGKNETLTKKGGSAEYGIGDKVTGVVDYINYTYKTMGDADYYGARASGTLFGISSGISLHRMKGDAERLRYIETRLYAAKDLQNWRLSFDGVNHHYDIPYNGIDNAYSVNGTVRYAISDSLTAGFSVDYGKTPDFVYNTTVLLNLVYNFKSGR